MFVFILQGCETSKGADSGSTKVKDDYKNADSWIKEHLW